ncbi:DbpA RNA binding domain-containing protein [Treponema sp.]|uniref:DbpA RNA binding domain-containing protein n=1 Tax=Treponema sp. TaxID=166 RepID=UPI003F06810D
MAYNNSREGFKLNEENIASFLADAVSRVETATNAEIETLKQIKKLFKKNVPFSRRNYVAALFIKNATSGFKSNRFNRLDKNEKFGRQDRFSRNESRLSNRSLEERKERIEKAPRVTIDPSVADTIFISVGRSRGVFPRDLVGLLVSVAGLERSRIGEIRVLSNYSFITLFAEDCDKTIKALNEYEYRGRKLSVSYSRKKDENEEPLSSSFSEAEESIPSNVVNDTHGDFSANTEEAKIAAEQTAFAATMSSAPIEDKPYSETTDDGQVKSHFGSGDAY